MNTYRFLPHKVSAYLSAVILAVVLLVSIPLGNAAALSCLNPIEMVDNYVGNGYAITLVTAGEIETDGERHDQSVTVVESFQGELGDTVTFIHDETWQYLCAGVPAEEGADVVYVTNDGEVIQTVYVDTPLYDALMVALEDAPETPVVTADTRLESLMREVITLLTQLLTLLQAELETELETDTEAEAGEHDDIIGLSVSEAEAYAAAKDVPFRIGRLDGEYLPVTMDYRPGRITAEVEADVVVAYSVE